jgi:hypothetical protein
VSRAAGLTLAIAALTGAWILIRSGPPTPDPVAPAPAETGARAIIGAPAEPQDPSPAPAPDNAAPVPDQLRFALKDQRDFLLVLRRLGTSLEDLEAWARTRGFPPATFTTGVGIPLDQPYRRYDEATLRDLAAGGDRWAMQFLASDLRVRAPLEAMDLYREAAVRGSVFAGRELGMLYRDLDVGVTRNDRMADAARTALEQMDAGHDLAETGLAWLIAAEADGGLPPGYFSDAAVAAAAPEMLARACSEAAGILASLDEERRNRNIGSPGGLPPPFTVAPPADPLIDACPENVLSDLGAKGCVQVLLTGGDRELTGWRCGR